MTIFKIAFRNIFRQRKRTLITSLTIMGGFVLSSIAIGWESGSYSSVVENFTRNITGHIQIYKDDYREKPTIYKNFDINIGDKLNEINGVLCWSPRLYAVALGMVGENNSGINIVGIDPELENITTFFNNKLIKGDSFQISIQNPLTNQGHLTSQDYSAIIADGLAKILNCSIGDSINILSQAADGSTVNAWIEIIGIVKLSDPIANRTNCYISIEQAQYLFVLEGKCHEIIVMAENLNIVDKLLIKIKNSMDNNSLEIVPWQIFSKAFYNAMTADKNGSYIMILIIMLLVGVGVLNAVLMTVLERTKEYGLLKAIGTKPIEIIKLIIIEITIIVILSLIVGILLSLIITFFLSVKGITLSNPITYGGMEFKVMKSEFTMYAFFMPGIITFFVAILVSIFPAIKAAKTDPAKSMRAQ